ncbi:MAG: c(7)-type cytochrome triheme domain-containing protein [Nitrospinota bacterium]
MSSTLGKGGNSASRFLAVLAIISALSFVDIGSAYAEYADVVINNYAEEQGMRPVVFPHWFHRIRFRCKVCHADLGFKFKAGGNKIKMENIIMGEFCGACHNGEVAWSPENCDMCHSGLPGTKTQIHDSTKQGLVAPPARGVKGAMEKLKKMKPDAYTLDEEIVWKDGEWKKDETAQ